MKKLYFSLLGNIALVTFASAQYSLTGVNYSQNFNTLSSTAAVTATGGNLNNYNSSLNGWYFLETGTNANTSITLGTGSASTGDTYNFGSSSSTDRTLGTLLSGTLVSTLGFSFTNNTGSTITSLTFSYKGEEWRLGSGDAFIDRLDFQYSTNATSLSTGTWLDEDNLDFNTPNNTTNGIKDGNATGNFTYLTHELSGLNIPNGATFWIRWSDFNVTGTDDGLGVDDFSLAVSSAYFRSAASGNWNVAGNWEVSLDGSTGWTTSTIVPSQNAKGVEIQSTHAITSTTNLTVSDVVVNGQLIMNPATLLTVNNSMDVATGANLTFKSDATGTASLANLGSAIILDNNNITIERHLQARRAWRLLAAPLAAATAPSIFNSWQEAGSSSGSYGTWITNTSAGNGYDAASTAPSLKYWDGTNLVAPSATNGSTKITDNGGAYFLFVRGDRTITGSGTANSTVLRMTGSINQGNVNNVGVIGSGSNPSLIPNPYPSSIDFEQIHAAYNSLTTFNVWDANLGTLGAYRLVDRNGGNYQQTPSGGSTTVDATARYIQSGQAFFIPAQQTINFTESMKATTNPSFNVFKTNSGVEELAVNLNIANTSGNILADGFRIKFDNSYASNAVQGEDITKMENINENLGVSNNGTDLIVDKRPVSTNDTIQLRFWNSRISNYTLDFEPNNMNSFSSVYLLDSHLGTLTTINAAATSSYSFNVDNNAGSYDPMRFKIVFTANPTSIEETKAVNNNTVVKLYPNPVTKDKQLHIQLDNLNEAAYTVQVYNIAGQLIISEVLTNNAKNATDLALDVNRLSEGTHLIKIMGKDGKTVATSTFIVNK